MIIHRKTSLLSCIVAGLGCATPGNGSPTVTTESSDTTDALVCGQESEVGLAVGMCAPDFSMPNRDGVVHTLRSERGKVALVDISAIW